MALVGNMIHEAVGGNPSIVNYTMFVAVFGMLSLLYLIGATVVEALFWPIAVLALDALNTLFFLVGGIALAADLGVHSCGNHVSSKPLDNGGMGTDVKTPGLHLHERDDRWITQPSEEMPRSPGCDCLPLVWLRFMGCITCLDCSGSKEQRDIQDWWYQKRWASHVAGLNGEQHATSHVATAFCEIH